MCACMYMCGVCVVCVCVCVCVCGAVCVCLVCVLCGICVVHQISHFPRFYLINFQSCREIFTQASISLFMRLMRSLVIHTGLFLANLNIFSGHNVSRTNFILL